MRTRRGRRAAGGRDARCAAASPEQEP